MYIYICFIHTNSQSLRKPGRKKFTFSLHNVGKDWFESEINLKHFILFWSGGEFEDDGVQNFCFSLLLIFVIKSGLRKEVMDFLRTEKYWVGKWAYVFTMKKETLKGKMELRSGQEKKYEKCMFVFVIIYLQNIIYKFR